MRFARRASLLVVFSLLTSAATTYAECAWVLWNELAAFAGLTALPDDAFVTREECQAEKARREAKNRAEGQGGRVICLPDTVDPRRAEGEVNDTDARLWHPWLRINRVLRAMLHERWSAGGVASGEGRVHQGGRAQERDPARGGSTDRHGRAGPDRVANRETAPPAPGAGGCC